MPPEKRSKPRGYFGTVAGQRCPECRRGLVYSHAMNMNTLCPVCGTRFEREPGYFTGAIYIGILLAIPPMFLLLYLLMRFLPEIPLQIAAVLSVLGFIPMLPLTLRLARVMWLGIGRDFSPDHFPNSPPDEPADEFSPSPVSPDDAAEEEPTENVEMIEEKRDVDPALSSTLFSTDTRTP